MMRYWLHIPTMIVMASLKEPEHGENWVEITKEEYEKQLNEHLDDDQTG